MLKKLSVYTLFLLATVSCSDEVTQVSETDSQQRAVTGDICLLMQIVAPLPDITVDAYVDPCEGVQNTDDNYCQCHPRCCQQQLVLFTERNRNTY